MTNDPTVAVPLDDLVSMIARERGRLVQEIRLSAARECAEIAEKGARSLVDYAQSLDPTRANEVRQAAMHLRLVGSTIRERFGLEKGGE